jgi:uncharacterized membrane protein YqjE
MERGPNPQEYSSARPISAASSRDLVVDFTKTSMELVRKEIRLAREELRQDIKREVTAAAGIGIAGLFAILFANALIATVILVLAIWLPAWTSALIVAGFLLCVSAIAGGFGWGKRVKTPLPKTQKTIKEDVQWAKERLT